LTRLDWLPAYGFRKQSEPLDKGFSYGKARAETQELGLKRPEKELQRNKNEH